MKRERAALLLVTLALVAAGCGGDDESAETVPPAPELSLPGEDTPTLEDPGDSTTATGTDAEPSDGGGDGGGGEATPPADGQDGNQGGGTPPPPPSGGQPAPNDTPQNDTPPPPGSPAERFEDFCSENPGAC